MPGGILLLGGGILATITFGLAAYLTCWYFYFYPFFISHLLVFLSSLSHFSFLVSHFATFPLAIFTYLTCWYGIFITYLISLSLPFHHPLPSPCPIQFQFQFFHTILIPYFSYFFFLLIFFSAFPSLNSSIN